MQQQLQKSKQAVKRMSDVVREQEAAEHAEMLSKARRASKHAQRTSTRALALLNEIEGLI